MTARFTKEKKIAVIVGATVMAIFLCLGVGMVMAENADGEETVTKSVYLRPGQGDKEVLVTFIGDGSAENPYQVSKPEQLDAIRLFTRKNIGDTKEHFIQTADIDLKEYIDKYYGGEPGPGWLPIGGNETKTSRNSLPAFWGIYDGGGYQIKNLYINREIEAVGLFSVLGKWASLKNIILVDVDVTGGYVYESTSLTGNMVSALLGENDEGVVSGSAIKGESTVTGRANYVGGLVGNNRGKIYDSYSWAVVSGPGIGVGGLVGYNSLNNSLVENSYSIAKINYINGKNYIGGLVGRDDATSGVGSGVISSYYDKTAANIGDGKPDTGKGVAKSLAELKSLETYVSGAASDWDFDNIWAIDTEGEIDSDSGERVYKNNGYPYLRIEKEYVSKEANPEDEDEAGEPEEGKGEEGGDPPPVGEPEEAGGEDFDDEPGPPVSPPAGGGPSDGGYDDSYDDDYDYSPAITAPDEKEDKPENEEELRNLDLEVLLDMDSLVAGLQIDLPGLALLFSDFPEDVRLLDPEFQPSNYYRAVVSADQWEGGRLVNLPTIFVWDGRSWQGMSVLPKLDIKWKGVSLAANQGEMDADEEVMSLAEGLLVEGSDIMVSPLYEYDFIDADLLTGALDFMAGRQIMRGYGSADSYLLNANGAASRAEFLAVLLRSLGLDLFLPGTSGFVGTSNSPEATWYEAYVDLAADLGLLEQLLSLGHEFSDLEDELMTGAGHEYWGQSISLLEVEILIEQLESLALYQNYLLLRERLDEMGLVYQLGMKVLEPVGENDIVIGSAKDDKRVKNVSVHEDVVDGDAYLTRAEMAELIYQLVFE